MPKKKKKEREPAEIGTFKYAAQTRMTNPIEFYHMRLEYLKRKRDKKRNDKNG